MSKLVDNTQTVGFTLLAVASGAGDGDDGAELIGKNARVIRCPHGDKGLLIFNRI